MIALYGGASDVVHLGTDSVADSNIAVDYRAEMDINAGRFLCVGDADHRVRVVDRSAVADLTAALAVERRLVEDDSAVALGNALNGLVVDDERDDLRVVGNGFGITGELRLRKGSENGLRLVAPAGDVRSRGACAGLLRVHERLEAVLVNAQLLLGEYLAGKVDREAECIVELEYLFAGDSVDPVSHRAL